MPRKTFSDVKREVAERAPPARPDWMCAAWGCPLRGTIFSGGLEAKCYLHDSHTRVDLPALTREIRARDVLFEAAERLMVGVDLVVWWTEIPGRFAKPFREHGREDLLPTVEERRKTITAWYSRVRATLEIEILAALGLNIASGKAPERRTYEPTEDDIEAARIAEQAIADGTWKKPGDLMATA